MKLGHFFSLVSVMVFSACSNSSEVYSDKEGIAINGYDPVAYFTENTPVLGRSELEYSWRGATWRFSNEQHLKQFQTEPDKYAPQYGGYCAFGLSNGYKASTSPDAWTIVDGKLYLNYNKDVRGEWLPKKDELIVKADSNWTAIRLKPM